MQGCNRLKDSLCHLCKHSLVSTSLASLPKAALLQVACFRHRALSTAPAKPVSGAATEVQQPCTDSAQAHQVRQVLGSGLRWVRQWQHAACQAWGQLCRRGCQSSMVLVQGRHQALEGPAQSSLHSHQAPAVCAHLHSTMAGSTLSTFSQHAAGGALHADGKGLSWHVQAWAHEAVEHLWHALVRPACSLSGVARPLRFLHN